MHWFTVPLTLQWHSHLPCTGPQHRHFALHRERALANWQQGDGWNRPDAKLWLPSGVKQGVQGRPPSLARSTMELSSSGPCPAPLAPFTTTSLHSRLEMAVDQRQSSWSELIEGRQNILSHLTFSLLSRLKMAPNSYHQGKKTLKGK